LHIRKNGNKIKLPFVGGRNLILDYSDYIYREGADGIENGRFKENNIDLFYSEKGICPFCKIKINNNIFHESRNSYPQWLNGSFQEWESVNKCPICGWWEHIYNNSSDAINDGIRLSEIKIHTAILRQYDVNSKIIGIDILSEYIKKNPDRIYNIHHKKMEELTQAIFKEYYNCEIELVGKSHDGGKDLILINSDQPTIIQVKRRTRANKVESVSSIRELLGATILSKAKSCIFVTTADHYSPMAIKEANMAMEIKAVEKYELIDYKRFIDILNLHKIVEKVPWKKLITLKAHESY
jgi:restriction system protein